MKAQVLEELIPLIDNFEAAKQFIKPDTDGEKKIENSYQGLYKQMVDLFKKMGIEAVQTVGKPFDPAVHEAIMRQPSTDVTEDTVLQEFRKGFRINGKLIRPAMVSVAVPEEARWLEGLCLARVRQVCCCLPPVEISRQFRTFFWPQCACDPNDTPPVANNRRVLPRQWCPQRRGLLRPRGLLLRRKRRARPRSESIDGRKVVDHRW